MTAEIAVMNREAIAIAADSAVTMRDETGEKVFLSANKIFALSKNEPVAAMIYGNASFMGVPWEPLVKLFRSELGSKTHPTIQSYADSFLLFLKNNSTLFPARQCEFFAQEHVALLFGMLHEMAKESIEKLSPGSISEAVAAVNNLIQNALQFWKNSAYPPGVGMKQMREIRHKYDKLVEQIGDGIFAGIKLSAEARKALVEIGLLSLLKCPSEIGWPSATGLVFAGFGTNEFYPALRSYSLHGIFDRNLHHKPEREAKIGFREDAAIFPFAQSEMVYAFMEGVDPEYQNLIEEDMNGLIGEYPNVVIDACDFLSSSAKKKLKEKFHATSGEVLKRYIDGLQDFRRNRFSARVLKLVSNLPKGELATLAESMVNLTSLRRKISMETETVGGPIDVAMISKGDGLIWIKRKHYFDPALNHQFFRNYNQR